MSYVSMEACLDPESIIDVMVDKGYVVFGGAADYNLNIVGIRTSDMQANTFNDWITVFYRLPGMWFQVAMPATTDPGTYYRKNPMNVAGTAIVKPGQYRGVFKLGQFRGVLALIQNKPITVYRDANRDEVLDAYGPKKHTGMYGIHIHAASPDRIAGKVDKWSAGCQVIQDNLHFDFLIRLCEKQIQSIGNSFTYTLLEERDFNPV